MAGNIICLISILLMMLTILIKPVLNIKIFGKTKELNTFYFFPLLGAIVIIVFGFIDLNYLKESFLSDSSINPIKIVVLLMSLSMLSITLDELVFFNYLASRIVRKVKNNQVKLFFTIFVLVSILTMFTSNDIVILTFTIFICHFAKHAKINPIPYLVMEFVAANTWSMIFIIGNPTNIYLASYFNITFLKYFEVMWLPTTLAGLSALGILYLLFKKELQKPIDNADVEEVTIEHKVLTIISVIFLFLTTLLLAISNYIHLEMYLITLVSALSLTLILIVFSIKEKSVKILKETYIRIPWNLAVFVFSMFVLILTLNYNGVFKTIEKAIYYFTQDSKIYTIFSYGILSTIADNIVNNIPMSLGFSCIIYSHNPTLASIYATIIGSNLGAYLTPIGALAGIMWMGILKKQEVKYSFIDFTKKGFLITFPVLIIALLGLCLLL